MPRLVHRTFLVGVLTCSCQAYPASNVSVSFVNPDRYIDAERARSESEQPLQGIAQHLQWLGQRYLPAEQTLKVQVLDVDLAGRYRFFGRSNQYVRVVDGKTDWPQITIRYVLEGNGRILQHGEETISDMGYLLHTNTYGVNEQLRYEKPMIDRWFTTHFTQGPSAGTDLEE